MEGLHVGACGAGRYGEAGVAKGEGLPKSCSNLKKGEALGIAGG